MFAVSLMQKTTPLLLRLIRLMKLLLHVTLGLLQSLIYPFFSLHTQRNILQQWSIRLLMILNIKLHCHGRLPSSGVTGVLFAVNHVSWLDIFVLMAACPSRFVAKSEIGCWPILGIMSRNTGTFFIEREKRNDTLRVNQQIIKALRKGERITIFPEGTTTDGTELKHFHASLLQPAVIADALLYPIAISYRNMEGNICQEAAFIEPSLTLSLRKILRQVEVKAELIFNEPIQGGTKNRRELARLAEQVIADKLSLPIPHKKVEKSLGPLT